MIEKLIDKFAHTFRLEQRIESSEDKITLITESYISNKLIFTHNMDMEELYIIFRDRMLKENKHSKSL